MGTFSGGTFSGETRSERAVNGGTWSGNFKREKNLEFSRRNVEIRKHRSHRSDLEVGELRGRET